MALLAERAAYPVLGPQSHQPPTAAFCFNTRRGELGRHFIEAPMVICPRRLLTHIEKIALITYACVVRTGL